MFRVHTPNVPLYSNMIKVFVFMYNTRKYLGLPNFRFSFVLRWQSDSHAIYYIIRWYTYHTFINTSQWYNFSFLGCFVSNIRTRFKIYFSIVTASPGRVSNQNFSYFFDWIFFYSFISGRLRNNFSINWCGNGSLKYEDY